MPAVLVLDGRDALSLDRARDDDGGLPGRRNRLAERLVDRVDVVPVDLDRVPAERFRARGVDVEVPADHRLAALAEPVHVDDRREVVELVVGGVLEGLPHRALGHLAVAAEHPHAGREVLEVLRRERHPHTDREALAERAGRDVDPRDERRRMSLEHAAVLAVGEDLVVRDDACSAVDRVQEHRRVALREDQAVVRRALRLREVVAEVAVHEHREQVGCGHRRGRDGRSSPPRPCGSSRRGTAAPSSRLSFDCAHRAILRGVRRGNVGVWHAADCTSSRSTASASGSTRSRGRCSRRES